MKALLEKKNEEAFELIADLIVPVQEIALNKDVKEAREKDGATRLDVLRAVMKSCKSELIDIFALMDGEDHETYEITAMDMMKKLMDLIDNDEIMSFF